MIAVPAYPLRRNRKDARLDAIVDDCRPAIAICEDKNLDTVSAQFSQVRVVTMTGLKAGSTVDGSVAIPAGDPGSTAYLQYTSG